MKTLGIAALCLVLFVTQAFGQEREKRTEQIKQELKEIDNYIDGANARIKAANDSQSDSRNPDLGINAAQAQEKIETATEELKVLQEKRAALVNTLSNENRKTLGEPASTLNAQRMKRLLDAYYDATKKVRGTAEQKLQQIRSAKQTVQQNIEQARQAFLQAKKSKLEEIDRAKTAVEKQKSQAEAALVYHQTRCDVTLALKTGKKVDAEAIRNHDKAIADAQKAIVDASAALMKYEGERLKISAQGFETSKDYQKAQDTLNKLAQMEREVQKWSSDQLLKLTSDFNSKKLSLSR